MAGDIRSFIAVELTKQVQDKLADLQIELKKTGADVKWVKTNNIHITLKFLGNISIEQIEKIQKILEEVCENYQSFKISISELGAFPKPEYPRVIWVGLEDGKDLLINIANDIEDKLEKIGFTKEERAYQPHITIGRIRSGKNRKELTEKLKQVNKIEPLYLDVNKIILFKSTLTSGGPIYEILREANLKAI